MFEITNNLDIAFDKGLVETMVPWNDKKIIAQKRGQVKRQFRIIAKSRSTVI